MSGHIQRQALVIKDKILSPKCNPLIQTDMIADNRSFTDNNSRTMINTEILSYFGSGMYIYTRIGMGYFCYNTRYYRHPKI